MARSGLFSTPGYTPWLITDTASQIGLSIQGVAIPLFVLALTGDAVAAGFVSGAAAIGSLLGSIPGGVLADTTDRRMLIRIGGILGCALSLTIVALQWFDLRGVALGCTVFGLFAFAGALTGQATNAALRSIIPTELYPRAMSVNQGRDSVIGMVAGPVSGALVAISAMVPFLANAAAQLLRVGASFALPALPPKEPDGDTGAKVKTRWRTMFAGFGIIARKRVLVATAVAAAVLNFSGSAIIFWLLIGQRNSPVAAGSLYTAFGIGALLASLVAGKIAEKLPGGPVLVVGYGVLAIGVVVAGFTPYAVTLGLLVVVAAANTVVNTLLMSYVAVIVPPEFQGRLWASLGLVSMAVSPLAPIAAGAVHTHLPAAVGVSLLGVPILLGIGVMLLTPQVRGMGKAETWEDDMDADFTGD